LRQFSVRGSNGSRTSRFHPVHSIVIPYVAHNDVNIFENLAGRDADYAVGGLDQIVALTPRVLTAKRIHEAETGAELLGLDEKTRAVGFPFCRFHGALSRVHGSPRAISVRRSTALAAKLEPQFLCCAKETVRSKRAHVNSVFFVQLRKRMASDAWRETAIKRQLKERGSLALWQSFLLVRSRSLR
jgi:hypothetical protein